MDNTEEFRCISLCSGYAGLELGIRRIIPNLRTVIYVEVEAFACANLVSKMETGKLDVAPIWTDIKTFDGKPFHKRIHFITAGYPCQPFSVAGKRQGTADPRHLWPYIARIVQAVRPVWCFFENVSGHLSIGFPEVYRSLRLMGYKVEAGLFTAEEVGAPHKRERLFILANSTNFDDRQRCKNEQGKDETAQKRRATNRRDTQLATSSYGTELANTTKQRMEGSRQARNTIINQNGRETLSCSCCKRTRWPSHPGQPQYEWEEPRVVDDSRKQKSEGVSQSEKRNCNRKAGNSGGQGQAQSRLGMSVDGYSSRLGKTRIDELRLLGNGVVPQQAEKAFRELMKFFEANR